MTHLLYSYEVATCITYLPIPLPKEMMTVSSKCSNTTLSIPSEALWNINGDSSLSAVVEILSQESGAWVQGWIFSVNSFSPKHLILRLNHEIVNGGPSKETVRNGSLVTARRIWRVPPPHLPVPGLHPPNGSLKGYAGPSGTALGVPFTGKAGMLFVMWF